MNNKQIKNIEQVIEDIHSKSTTLNFELIKDFSTDSEDLEEILEVLLSNYDLSEVYRDSFIGLSFMVTNALKDLVLNSLEYKNTNVYKVSMQLDEQLTKHITEPVNSLIEYHLSKNKEDKLMALITAFKCLDLEDEIKKITLTGKQYKTWLESNIQMINTEQFEILYGMSLRKQAELRSFRKDPLPSYQIDGKGKHYYNRIDVDNWLDNYKRQSYNKAIQKTDED